MPMVVVCVAPTLSVTPVIIRDSVVSTFVGDGKGMGLPPEKMKPRVDL
jgi:hypothetical protein